MYVKVHTLLVSAVIELLFAIIIIAITIPIWANINEKGYADIAASYANDTKVIVNEDDKLN